MPAKIKAEANTLQDHEWVELLREAGLVEALGSFISENHRGREERGLDGRALDRAWLVLSKATKPPKHQRKDPS